MRKSKRTFRMFVEEELGGFPHFVVWAVLEWMLIISLYLDGFLAFISNKFADIFELDPPCVLCTRVDHALGGKNSPTSYYSDSICDSHKKDISSLAYCHVHRKLSDIRTMCDGCLLSLSTEKESASASASDNHKQRDADHVKDQKMFTKPEKKLTDNNKNDNAIIDTDRCSCCGESLKPKQPSKELSRNFSNLRASSQIPSSSPRASGLFPTSSPRASSLFPSSSPRASLMFPTSSPRASSSLFPNSSPRAFSSLFPSSSPRASSSLFPASSPRFSSLAPMASPRAAWRVEEAGRNSELSQARWYTELRFVSDNEPDIAEYDFGMNTNAKHYEEINEDTMKTPSHIRGNKFFGVSFAESIGSPRWAHKPPKKAPLEKSDLFSETTDEPPADGGSILQQLKKQVSDNRKTLVTLYLELDEERCAAAVAANNAMAMITRLQAEKAAVHMEALQYQRMMDEQAEYDEEAIQILRDLYLKKEENVKVLETELDVYRARYGEIKKMDSDEYDEYYDEFHPRSVGDRSEFESVEDDQSVDGNRKGNHEKTSGNFETERSHLFGMLKEFENHVRSSSREDQELDDRDTGDNASFIKEVNLMREKLAAIEAESGFLKQTAMTLERGDEGTKILSEIAQHLRKLNS